jgi:hypothetical protein
LRQLTGLFGLFCRRRRLTTRSVSAASTKDAEKNVHNVEIAAARMAGREMVDYVSNIYKYYVAYKLTLDDETTMSK